MPDIFDQLKQETEKPVQPPQPTSGGDVFDELAAAPPKPPADESLISTFTRAPGRAWDAGGQALASLGQGQYDQAAGHAAEAVRQVGTTLLPVGVAALAATPIGRTAMAIAGKAPWGSVLPALTRAGVSAGVGAASGYVAQKAAEGAAEALGAGPGVKALAGEVAGVTALPGTARLTHQALGKVGPRPAPPAGTAEALAQEFARKRDVAAGNLANTPNPNKNGMGAWQTLKAAVVQEEAPALDYIFNRTKAATAQRKTAAQEQIAKLTDAGQKVPEDLQKLADVNPADVAWEAYNKAENAVARSKRPQPESDALHQEIGIPDLTTELGGMAKNGVSGVERYAQFLRARVENYNYLRDKVSHLPGTGGDPLANAERAAKNDEIIRAFKDEFEPLIDKHAKMNYLNAKIDYDGGFMSKETFNRITQGIEAMPVYDSKGNPHLQFTDGDAAQLRNRSKQVPILTDAQKLQLIDMGDKYRQGVGVKSSPFKKLDHILDAEAENPLQATMAETAKNIAAANKNKVLQQMAAQARPGDADALKYAKAGDFSDLTLLSKPPGQGMSVPVFFEGKEMHLAGPPDLIAGMKLFSAQDPAESNMIVKTFRDTANYLNRTTKLAITGALAVPFWGMSRALNLGSVYAVSSNPARVIAYALQNLPLAALHSGPATLAMRATGALSRAVGAGVDNNFARAGFNKDYSRWMGIKQDKDLLRMAQKEAAVGTSAELYRNSGDTDVELAAMAGMPLGEKLRFIAGDPLKELGRLAMGQEANKRTLSQPLRYAEDLTRTAENFLNTDELALRMGIFKAEYRRQIKAMEKIGEVDENAAREAAGNVARNLLGNFANKGTSTWIPQLFSPYFNAIIQGQRGMYNQMRQNPVTAARRAAYFTIPMGFSAHRAYMDKEMADVIDGTSPEERAKYMWIKSGPIERDDMNRVVGGIVKIPVPEPYRPVNAFIQAVAKATDAEGKTPEVVGDMLVGMFNNISPIPYNHDPISTLGEAMAQVPVVGPAIEIGVNKQMFSGAPVVSNRSIERTPALVRNALGQVPGTNAWYMAKQQFPMLRVAENQARGDRTNPINDWMNPIRRFTQSSTAFRGMQRKEQLRNERLERWGENAQ